jgi:hypothetical protein
MKPESSLEIAYIGIGSETLLVDLARVGVEFEKIQPPAGVILNSGNVIKIALRFIPKTFATMATWLKARPSRRMQISFKNGQIAMFDAQNYSSDEVLKVLSEVRSVNVLETKKPEAPDVKESRKTEAFAIEVCLERNSDAAAVARNPSIRADHGF